MLHATLGQRIASNGAVAENVEIRLLDLPELGYLTSDSPPRGEILARTSYMAGQLKCHSITVSRVLRQPAQSRILQPGEVH